MTTSTTTAIVTPEQIAMCARVYDEQGNPFYMVESESDPTIEYTVKAEKINGRYWLTCTCKAGMSGTPCKHKRWATAAAQVDRTQVKVEAMTASTPTFYTNVDAETLARVTRASLANRQAPKSLVEQDARHYNSGLTFRLMK